MEEKDENGDVVMASPGESSRSKPPTEAALRKEAARVDRAHAKQAKKEKKAVRDGKLRERRKGVDGAKVRLLHHC